MNSYAPIQCTWLFKTEHLNPENTPPTKEKGDSI